MKIIDPLAQSFYVSNEKGTFVTAVDLFFSTKDDTLPVTVQLRPMEGGIPSQKVYPFSEVVLEPKEVDISDDATAGTRIEFPSPVYLEGGRFHALVVTANTTDYNIWISKLGEVDITTESETEAKQIVVSKQPVNGGLFKSQNSQTWTESGFEDLKFTLYRANFFEDEGTVSFFNPELTENNKQVPKLDVNPLEFSSKKIRVSLGSTLQDTGLILGNTVSQFAGNATGNYVDSGGVASGTLRIINAGIGYTPSSGIQTYTNVGLTTVTGNGKNATATITVTNGSITSAGISTGGTGYVVGDVLSADTIGSEALGLNLQLSVSTISGINELILDNVQGDFLTGSGSTVSYINSSGVTTALNSTVSDVIIPNGGIRTVDDGLHAKVRHRNHGMHGGANIVKISNVSTNVKPIKLTSAYTKDSNSSIEVNSTINFETFENVGVSSLNPGYVLIGKELIAYEGVTANTLTGITREIDQTIGFSYDKDTPVKKYELNGVSLRRINRQHTLQDSTIQEDITLDSYNIKIDMSQNGNLAALPQGQVDRSTGIGFPKLYFNESKSLGGNNVTATQNIQFEILKPDIQTLVISGTNIDTNVRTVTGRSVNGSEGSFEDDGFTTINLTDDNYFDSPRLICSKENETEILTNLPGNKSFNLDMELSTTDVFISPVIDLDRTSVTLISNRINNVIDDFATDSRVATTADDPSAFVYATQVTELEIPATTLKVLLSAYINEESDVRALYYISNNPDETPVFYPFPGFDNSDDLTREERNSQSDGTSDEKIVASNVYAYESDDLEFNDYEFTVDNLPTFKYFAIKLVGTGTNQAHPPRFGSFRTIAFA